MSLSNKVTPKVAIIGRPNVGKSTLFNVLTRTRKSVVKNEAGVTRDIQIEPTEWWGKKFDVVDTGGLTEAEDTFSKLIKENLLEMIHTFDLLIVVMDGKSGLLPEDRLLVRLAQESEKPFVIVVNKVDQMHKSDLILSEFYEFGEDLLACSFEKRDNVDELVEWVIANLKEPENTVREGLRIAIVGKPNVGKSSLCNYLLGKNRMLVSDIAGTTVDAIETAFEHNGQPYIIVDTAGMRRQSKRNDGVEYLSAIKSQKAIARADIVLLVVDAVEGPTKQDANVVEYILSEHKTVILVANKLDLAKETRPEARKWFRGKVEQEFHFFKDIPVTFTCAHSGTGVVQMLNLLKTTWERLNIKISTSQLNKFFYDVIRQAPSPVYGTKNVKFYYLTQTEQVPPSFIAFANHPDGVTPSYRRFLSNRIKKNWDLQGLPVRIFIMRSGR